MKGIEKKEFGNKDERINPLDAENNDSLSEKWVIVIFLYFENRNDPIHDIKIFLLSSKYISIFQTAKPVTIIKDIPSRKERGEK